jgi:hypothetical protein
MTNVAATLGKEGKMLLALAAVLLLAWIISFVLVHVTSAAIHLLLIFAAVSLLVHLVRSARHHTAPR